MDNFTLNVKVEVWDGVQPLAPRLATRRLVISGGLATLRLAANGNTLQHLVRQALADAEDAVGMAADAQED